MKNPIFNIVAGLGNYIIITLLGFISRTVFIIGANAGQTLPLQLR
ncbi:hypothetical protein OF830_07955 [Bacillus paramycoides]|nr:hypothetical protein [Bacillus paramycoides]MCW9130890.1 hypothetical protein [Bacillus paramycoides]MED0978654.1 hypothetical protein [Bacillus paramycoides]